MKADSGLMDVFSFHFGNLLTFGVFLQNDLWRF